MTPAQPPSTRLTADIARALNRIKKPSTAGEITELLNRELDPDDRAFRTQEVEDWLRDSDTTAKLYWLESRPRR